MTIATKGGSLIVKDGKLAQNCACCGQTCESILSRNELVISVAASDRIAFVKHTFPNTLNLCTAGTEWCQTLLWPGSNYSGTFALTKISSSPARWKYTYPISAPVCANPFSGTQPFLQIEASCNSTNEIYLTFTALLYTLWYQDRRRGSTCSARSKSDFDCVYREGNANCGGGSNFISSVPGIPQNYSGVSVTVLAPDANPTAFPVINDAISTSTFLMLSGVQTNIFGIPPPAITDTGDSGGSAIAVSFVPQ
jgi:hypothetical protein